MHRACGVTAYAVDMRGGYGGSRNAIWGGLGAKLTGKINVTPGADLTVDVAANGIIIDNTGGGGSNGGSGGGYSAIQTTSGPIVVAGGGGGVGSSFFPTGITATTAFVDNADKAPRVALVVAFGVASVSPLEGPAAGGTSITITGTEFTADATVTVGGAGCTPVVFVSTTEISCTTTAHAAGAADVAVTVGGETVTMTSAFTFTGSDTPAASVCPLTLVKPLPARKRLPVGKPIQLLKGARTVSSCTLRLNSSGRIATRGDMRGVRIVVNKRTGRVVALATTRNAKAKLTVVATPKLAPYNQRSDRFARSWTS